MGYISGDNNQNKTEMTASKKELLQFTIYNSLCFKDYKSHSSNKDISIEALARFSGLSDSVFVSR